MTSAHRPTFNPAVGRNNSAVSLLVSAKDQVLRPLKYRQSGQNSLDELSQRDLRDELLRKEGAAAAERNKQDKRGFVEAPGVDAKRIKLVPDEIAKLDADDDDDDDDDDDADEPVSNGKGKAKVIEDEDEDDESDEDDTAELLRELERIKKERAEEQERAAKQKAAEAERIRTEQILVANPLMNQPADYTLKKKWYDDVIFKNCAKKEPEEKKRFVNDTIRSDFHRKFLAKYVA